MFESRPELINVFSSFEGKELSELRHSRLLHEHALRVMATVESVISQIDDLPAVAKTLKEVGEIHRRYNVPSDLFQANMFGYFILQ
ncbi:hypothetical protein DPMN_130321 [Dreissena polymorpha]|uniref:Globin domain-containing protein n=1 Tax=Dreissena polymorpha TaxID=45954 RepID=A0A9D4K1Q2_DREPO|nr:hypothetical protein DPMN_130321 [Dreissena polymorpha]